MNLHHKGCGGEVIERHDLKPYEYTHEAREQEDQREKVELHYPQFCEKCGIEITGDSQIEEDYP